MVKIDIPRKSRRWFVSERLLPSSSMALPYAKLSGSVKRQAPQARTCVLFNLGNGTLGQPICRRTQLAFHANKTAYLRKPPMSCYCD